MARFEHGDAPMRASAEKAKLPRPPLIITLVLALFACAVPANTQPAAPPYRLDTPMDVGAPNIDALAEKARTQGRIRVIASVARPLNMNPDAISSSDVANLTSRFVNQADALGIVTVKPLADLPLVVLELTAEQLEQLVEAGLVANVVEDVPEGLHLGDSIPLIQAGRGGLIPGADGLGQTIAILDSGIEADHPFFGGRIVAEACFSTNDTERGATSLCPDGRDNSIAEGSAAPCEFPRCGHGTHVAGIAAGRSAPGEIRRGVAPRASLIAIQVFSLITDSAVGPIETCAQNDLPSPCVRTFRSDQILALRQLIIWAADFEIAAVNMSIGGSDDLRSCDDDLRKEFIDYLRGLGIATVISSGNDGHTDGVSSPGCITTAITVGATTKADEVWGDSCVPGEQCEGSNSAEVVDFLAPGAEITSAVPNRECPPESRPCFGSMWGTSMAAPHVAGAFAALRSLSSDLTVAQIEQVLKATGAQIIDFREGAERRVLRRINLYAAACSVRDGRLVPHVLFVPAALGAQRVRDAGFQPRFAGDIGVGNTFISNVSPAPGNCVPAGSTVTLTLRAGRIP
jgi:subtilisin family serine protease